jgi:hypothetical protein
VIANEIAELAASATSVVDALVAAIRTPPTTVPARWVS